MELQTGVEAVVQDGALPLPVMQQNPLSGERCISRDHMTWNLPKEVSSRLALTKAKKITPLRCRCLAD